jgi:phosphatidylserine/phosphatidylglycerophosphate/cardiolipin synthase-like enzyme
VISAALWLAFRTAAAGLPQTALVPDAAIAACFAPEQNCAALAVVAIDRARRQILVSAYNLTVGSGVVEALVRARERGVDVRLIADKRTPCERAAGIGLLAAAGTPI